MGQAFDWTQLRQLSCAPKLSDCCQQPQHLFDFYYRVGETEYVFAAPHWNEDYTEHAIYVGGFYWAPSLATFRRMVVREIDAVTGDDGTTYPLPDGLLLARACVNFESILRFASSNHRLRWRVLDLFA